MNRWIRDLIDFHQQIGDDPVQMPNRDIPEAIRQLRGTLMKEELEEVLQAMEDEPIENIAKELADLIYVTLGTVNAYGLQDNFTEVFAAVHQNNLAKFASNAGTRADGKLLKKKNHPKPDIKKIIGGK